jgi:hypothetical protein
MTDKQGYSSVGGLVMARAQKRPAEDNQEGDQALNAIGLERRALEAIRVHQSELPTPENPAALR